MTLSELHKYRRFAPVVIVAICMVPVFLISDVGIGMDSLVLEWVLTAIALGVAFFYDGLGMRNKHWKSEKEKHILGQIRSNVLDLIPSDLSVTEKEKVELAKTQIINELTGIFWETVNNNDELRDHKQHFYSNGFPYTTSIDVYIICVVFSSIYCVLYWITGDLDSVIVSVILLIIALASNYFVKPYVRKQHQQLSRQQLDLLKKRQKGFVEKQFRGIVSKWRGNENESA